MRVILEKDIDLSIAILFLKIERQKTNEDIKKYLNKENKYDDLIDKRIKDYLKEIGIYDEKYCLTEKGNKVKENGIINIIEEGLYQIWYSNDLYFGNKIFYLKRIYPKKDTHDKYEKLNLNLNNVNYCLKSNKNDQLYNFKIINNDYIGKELSTKEKIKCKWEWNDFNSSIIKFEGKLNNNKDNRDYRDIIEINCVIKGEDFEKNLEEFFSQYITNWDKKNKRYKIYFNDIQNNETKHKFEYKEYNITESELFYKQLGFKGKIYNLELMPYNINEAIKWRDFLLSEELKKEYYNNYEFNLLCNDIKQRNPLNIFDLPDININEFRKSFKRETTEFWHINATIDLNPYNYINYKQKVEINENKYRNIKLIDIINELDLKNLNYDYLFYYDKYAMKYENITINFLKSIHTNKKIVLYLDKDQNSYVNNEFINIKNIFKDQIYPHDRYIITIKNNIYTVWNASNSIGIIEFKENNITPYTSGKLKHNIVYTKVSKEQIPEILLNFIKNYIRE